jgi:8-oxo-dGTP pyrophosphatase MutT (NUDIX family)
MTTLNFQYKLKEALQSELPAWKAHIRLAPVERFESLLQINWPTDAKQSAVLVILFIENEQVHVLLILRSIYDGAHSGQISFPGGQKEKSDIDLVHTALRECSEEIGLFLSPIQILGKLSELYIPPSNFIVFPFVAFTENIENLRLDSHEVQEVIKIPLRALLNPAIFQIKQVISRNDRSLTAPCFDIEDKYIWGATAMILNELMTVIETNNLLKFLDIKNA